MYFDANGVFATKIYKEKKEVQSFHVSNTEVQESLNALYSAVGLHHSTNGFDLPHTFHDSRFVLYIYWLEKPYRFFVEVKSHDLTRSKNWEIL